MQTSVTDSITNITIVRDVARIEIYLPSVTTERRIEVYTEEIIKAHNNKQFGQPRWIGEPLIIDLAAPRVVQAMALLKAEIEEQENARIIAVHGVTPTPAPTPTPTPAPTPAPTPTPTPAPVPTPTPPRKP